jgi:hypothetical protein
MTFECTELPAPTSKAKYPWKYIIIQCAVMFQISGQDGKIPAQDTSLDYGPWP